MPNIQGDYSLTEVATKLNISAAWINKVQRETGVCVKESAQGKRAEFSADDVKMLENVKLLRLLDYSLDDIKQIYELEKRIGSIGYLDGIIDKGFNTIISNKQMLVGTGGNSDDENVKAEIFELLKGKHNYTEEQYDDDVKKLLIFSAEVTRRVKAVEVDIKQLHERLSENTRHATERNLF